MRPGTEMISESVYDRVNDYGSIKITLASPNDIRSWSFGEVKKPETINYRTYRPEKDGLFCERIFGPERDYECGCGKYKGTKFKGIICDRCGVKVTHSRVRRKRMGHINLAAPVVHIWFFKALPSRLGTLLKMKTADMEKVIYFQDYVILDPGSSEFEYRQVITEDEFRAAVVAFGATSFRAGMGADAVRELLENLDLHETAEEIREGLAATKSKQKTKDLAKRLKLVEQIRKSPNDPTWMVLDVVPVIPPDLRPLVLLESGNFATSDLNDLYRRIINRNNRLKKLMDLNAPEVIIRNEKRMLQQAVDALVDNGRCRRPVLGSSNRPLKSLTDMIKGKQGRFRENLLGKRVDYSARSVIVVGPNLKLHQCGLPKKIALELYQPFIIRRLKEQGLADTIKSAKRMLERRDPEVWDILEQVIYQHPVLLNRAPTLHRMGIQAFEPVLVEGKAITLHPLVCTGYNADFDGDQMAVHLPLSIEAQVEAHVLMLSTHNVFSPANGHPIVSPSQDIVMGVYFLTVMDQEDQREAKDLRHFMNTNDAMLAYDYGQLDLHERIVVRLERFNSVVDAERGEITPLPKNRRVITTVGRVLFSEIIADGMPYYNCILGKKGCSGVIDDVYRVLGRPATLTLLDDMKETGFKHSTLSGLSIAITDLRIPDNKDELIGMAQKKVDRVEKHYGDGAITERERHNQLLDIWAHCREELTKSMISTLQLDRRDDKLNELPIEGDQGSLYLNPVYLMSTSGARGNVSQMQQLAGMRGLMAKPSGEIIETPIRANFREGLNVLEYFSSTHGARKGLADTALKTADSGYLTRKLYDVGQALVIIEQDCGSRRGITKKAVYKGEEIDIPLGDSIVGRTSRQTIINPKTDESIIRENQIITSEIAEAIEQLGIDAVQIRSPLTCETSHGICAKCYGMDMSTGKRVEEGLAVGTIAAQSIGEPGTQLTMRTFHTGGIAARGLVDTKYVAGNDGTIEIRGCRVVEVDGCLLALKRNGELAIMDAKGREMEKYKVPYGATLHADDGSKVSRGDLLVEWDPHRTPILAEQTGIVKFKDIVEGETIRIESAKGTTERIVIEHRGEKHPQIIIEDKKGNILDFHPLPAKARIEVKEGQEIKTGQMLARQPKEVARSADIVGGLPRVTEIFEARTPKDPAVTSLISGRIELYSDKRKGKITVRVISDADIEEDHHVPQGKHLLVQAGDMVQAGQPLTEGPLIPKDILDILGVEALYSYMLEEVQNVYRAQGVPISDKHIEVVLSAMLGKIEVNENGDTELLPHDVVDQYAFRAANERIMKMVRIKEPGETPFVTGDLVLKTKVKEANDAAEADGKTPAKSSRTKPASGKVLLLGITKASLQSESFLSGASFQETTKVLTEAALRGATDELQGLKENVLLGHLIPAGTGFEPYTKMRVRALVEPPADEFSDEEVMRTEAAHLAEVAGAEPATAMIIGSTPERDDAAEADAQEAIATGDPINVSDPLL
jgi:DNA-directed RNA polymerase subunit beta'